MVARWSVNKPISTPVNYNELMGYCRYSFFQKVTVKKENRHRTVQFFLNYRLHYPHHLSSRKVIIINKSKECSLPVKMVIPLGLKNGFTSVDKPRFTINLKREPHPVSGGGRLPLNSELLYPPDYSCLLTRRRVRRASLRLPPLRWLVSGAVPLPIHIRGTGYQLSIIVIRESCKGTCGGRLPS